MAYKLDLPTYSRIHPIFHVSRLKKKLGEENMSQTKLPLTDDQQILIALPQQLLATRMVKTGKRNIKEVLVQWEGSTAAHIRTLWAMFFLGGGGGGGGGGIDMSIDFGSVNIKHFGLVNNRTIILLVQSRVDMLD